MRAESTIETHTAQYSLRYGHDPCAPCQVSRCRFTASSQTMPRVCEIFLRALYQMSSSADQVA